MANTSKRVAANRANARRSTGPKTPEGKARAAQNARKHRFNPDPFAIVRMEDRAQIAALVADAVATYQPINSQERLAVERIALAQHSMLRMYALEAGFFTNCFDQAMCGPKEPDVLQRSEISQGIETTLAQNRAFWLAYGLNIFNRQSNIASTFLRFQAQAERLHRRAVEDFHRLLKLRGQLPPEKYEVPNEPNIEPTPEPQPTANTAAPAIPQPVAQTPNEPNAKPSPPPVTAPRREPHAKDNPRPALVPQSSQPPRRRHAANRLAPRDRLSGLPCPSTGARRQLADPCGERRSGVDRLRKEGVLFFVTRRTVLRLITAAVAARPAGVARARPPPSRKRPVPVTIGGIRQQESFSSKARSLPHLMNDLLPQSVSYSYTANEGWPRV